MMIEVLYREIKRDDSRFEFIQELYQGVLTLKETLLHSFDIVNYADTTTDNVSLNKLILDIAAHYKEMNYPELQLQLSNNDYIIKGNLAQLKLALENIIQNALDASQNSQQVNIKTYTNQHDKTVQMEVTDFGSGIAIKDLDKIFNIFYTTRGEGRGLGLTITRNIIKNHGGYINVNSTVGKGTKITVMLPLNS